MDGMFYGCSSLKSLNLSNFDTSSVTTLEHTFNNCNSLKSIYLTNWNTTSLRAFNYTFANCGSLESLDLSHFNTTSLNNMIYLFENCTSLKSLDLSNFDTTLVTEFRCMFRNCKNLTYLDISNFDTSKMTRMSDMFRGCVSLTSLNLSSFNTSLVNYLGFVFYQCSSLESLDLSNFDTSSTTQMLYMFNGCSKLKYLNINNFNTSLVNNTIRMFYNCGSLLSLNLTSFNTSMIRENGYTNMFQNVNPNLIYCIDDKKSYIFDSSLSRFTKDCNYICKNFYNQSFIKDKVQCIDKCIDDDAYQYEYNNTCYEYCPNGSKLIINSTSCIDDCSTDNKYKYEYQDKCYKECPYNSKLINNSYLCIDNCNNSINNRYEYQDKCYKECPYNSKLINNSYLCIDNCINSINNIYEYQNKCYKECPYNSKLINNSYLCIDNCINSINNIYEYNNKCYKECPYNSKLINNSYLCIDNCLSDVEYNYEYKNKCYKYCPNKTFYYNEDKFCYDKIPDGFYCNDTVANTLDKCHENCKTCNEGPKIYNNNCLTCPDTGNIYLNLGNCTNNCSKGFFIYKKSIKICKCIYAQKCNYCSLNSIESDLCLDCNNDEGFYEKIDDEFSLEGFIDCYKDPEGYYLEKNLYQKCYKSCKFCSTRGDEINHKCLQCYENYTYVSDFDNINNCYNKCDFYYYYDKENDNKYQCTLENNCPEKYSKSIEDKKRCIDSCYNDNIYKYEYKNSCYESCPIGTILSFNISFFCQDIEELQKYNSKPVIFEKVLNLSDEGISIDNINTITSEYLENVANYTNFVSKLVSDSYKLYIYKDSSALEETADEAPQIDFGECYEKVKKYYNINENLLVTLINNEEDKVYGKASNKYTFSNPYTGEVLNTTNICNEDDKIIVKESINALLKNIDGQKEEYINYLSKQGIDIFNLSNRFYSDLCYYFESPNGKDVPLKDRISSFFPNITLCDPGCENKGIDFEKMKAKCECVFNNLINNKIVSNINMGTVSDVIAILYSLNINVVQCIPDVFNPIYLKKCIGGFIILFCLFIQLICVIKFLSIGLYSIRKYIFSLNESFYLYKLKNNINEPPRKKRSKTTKKSLRKLNINSNSQNSNNKILKNSLFDTVRNLNKKTNTVIYNKFNFFGPQFQNNEKSEKKEKLDIKHIKNTEDHNEHYKKIEEYLNESFDENDFCDILDKETRSFGTYFCEKFKKNQIIINTFCIKDVFKPRTFKIILFIITIELYLVINALFYNEEYLSKIFNSNKPEHFFSFVQRRIKEFFYTSVVSIMISYLIGCFSIEEEKVKRIFIRFHKNETRMKYELSLILITIKKRFILFIIFSLFLSIVSFFYISCFNIVYPYIRIEWIKSSIFIFIVMEIVNFLLIFFGCCFRYIAIKCNSEKLFKISLLIN